MRVPNYHSIPEHDSQHLPPWKGVCIALMDLDAFFASVEQLDHPEWRNKPLIVGSPGKRGVVATASYEARMWGVHSAMPAAQAQKLCPQALWVQGRMERYRELSQIVMSIIQDETPFLEQVSIDEAFFDLTPSRAGHEHPVIIARRIQKRVAELGLTCSIGLSNNKTCSKIASDTHKPFGLTVIYPEWEERFLAPLPISKLSGIGKKTHAKLKAMGIHHLGELAAAPEYQLQDALGIWGPRLKLRAQGRDFSPVVSERDIKSISHERTFSEDICSEEELYGAIAYLCGRVARRLRKHGLKAATLSLKLRFDFEHTKTVQQKLPCLTDQEHQLMPYAYELLHKLWYAPTPVRLVGIQVQDFNEEVLQLNLFDSTNNDTDERKRKLSYISDSIKNKFGEQALMRGRDIAYTAGHISCTVQHEDKFEPDERKNDS